MNAFLRETTWTRSWLGLTTVCGSLVVRRRNLQKKKLGTLLFNWIRVVRSMVGPESLMQDKTERRKDKWTKKTVPNQNPMVQMELTRMAIQTESCPWRVEVRKRRAIFLSRTLTRKPRSLQTCRAPQAPWRDQIELPRLPHFGRRSKIFLVRH